MKNRFLLSLVTALLLLSVFMNPGSLWAAERINKLCPVSGDKISANGKFSYDYQGKTYGFCCMKCIKAFEKNPEKYLAAAH